MVLVSFALFAYLMRNRFNFKTLGYYALGGVLPGLLTAWFHTAAFGSPLTTAYTTLENPQFVKDIAPGVMGLRAPSLENMWGAFVSPFEGLFYFAPWMALTVFAIPFFYFVQFKRAPSADRTDFTASTVSVGVLTLFIACHSLWRGGWTLGPRYIVPFVPFAALLILHAASALSRRAQTPARAITAVLVVLSVVVTGACSLVSQGFHTIFFNPLAEVALPLLRDGFVTWSLGHALGLKDHWPLVPLLILVLPGLIYLLWRASGPRAQPWPRRLFIFCLMLLLIAGAFRALLIPQGKQTLRSHKALTWTRKNFYPYGHQNTWLKRAQLPSKAARTFPKQESIQLLRMNELVRQGRCEDSIPAQGRRQRAEKARLKHLHFTSALTAIQPIPTGVPVPLLLRPDFRPSVKP